MSASHLSELFIELFSREELERFLGESSRTAPVLHELPGRDASRSMFARNAAEALGRRGFIDGDLFWSIQEARPGRSAEITAARDRIMNAQSNGQPVDARRDASAPSAPFVLISSRTHDRDERFTFSSDTTVAELVRRVRDVWGLPPHQQIPGVVAVYSYSLVSADETKLSSTARVLDVATTGDNLRLLTEVEQKATAPVYAGKLNVFSLLGGDSRQGGSTLDPKKTGESDKPEDD